MEDFSDITVAILVGGLGRRLRSVVSDKPKVLAKIHGKPFLAYILDQLSAFNLKRVILCTGYLGSQIGEEFGDSYRNLSLAYSQESSSLGTAGAIRLALPLLKSETIMIMNGDSFYNTNLVEFWDFHRNKNADVSLALVKVPNTKRYGKIEMDRFQKIVGFTEKKVENSPGWINGGVYLITHTLLEKIPSNRFVSFEQDIFPIWAGKRFYGYKSDGNFLDISIPQSFALAGQFFSKIKI